MPDVDRELLESLLERHLAGLRAFVQRNLGADLSARESSSDLVQSVCRELLDEGSRFEYQGEAAFRQWLQRAALRKILDRRRHYQAQKRDGAQLRLSGDELEQLARSLSTPSDAAALREETERLERAFERLEPADRERIRLCCLEGLPHLEVARRMGTSELASRKSLSRALARLSREVTRRE